MPAMSMCTCMVVVGGDLRSQVFRGPHKPVSWPEIEVLKFTHGKGSVKDITVISERESSIPQEKQRLAEKYGGKTIEQIYPGKRPGMEFTAPDNIARLDAPKKKKSKKKKAAAPPPEVSLEDEVVDPESPFTDEE